MKEGMSIQEKQILVSVITSVLVLCIYCLYIYLKYIAVNVNIINDFRFWGKAFLILIPVSIAAQIVVHIIFAIYIKITTGEDISTIRDERDKLIELKTIRISHWIFLVGFFMAMGSLAFGKQPWVMFVTLIFSGFIASIISEVFKLYYYRKGV